MRFLQISFVGLFIVAACGGAPGSPLDDGGPAGDASNGNDAMMMNNDSGNGNDSSAPDGSVTCVDEHGSYTMTMAGPGCGVATGTDVKECITQMSCAITITAESSQPNAGIKGTTPIQTDGSFMNATITEMGTMRTGCDGTWNNATSTLTIDCGGMNTQQTCTATLVRSSLSCN